MFATVASAAYNCLNFVEAFINNPSVDETFALSLILMTRPKRKYNSFSPSFVGIHLVTLSSNLERIVEMRLVYLIS